MQRFPVEGCDVMLSVSAVGEAISPLVPGCCPRYHCFLRDHLTARHVTRIGLERPAMSSKQQGHVFLFILGAQNPEWRTARSSLCFILSSIQAISKWLQPLRMCSRTHIRGPEVAE